jgi:hypothetical protein
MKGVLIFFNHSMTVYSLLDLITIYLCDLDLLLQQAKNDASSKVLTEVGLTHPDAVFCLDRDNIYCLAHLDRDRLGAAGQHTFLTRAHRRLNQLM